MATSHAKTLAPVLALDRGTLLSRMAFFPESQQLDDLRELLTQDADLDVITACKRVGLAPRLVLAAFTEATLALDRETAKAAAHASLPEVVGRLSYHAMPQVRRCPRLCSRPPTGGLKTEVMLGTQSMICPQCDGEGSYLQESEHMTWAADKLLKIGELPEVKTGPLVAIQNNTINPNSNFLERLLLASDSIVSRASLTAPIIEAEVVSK